jgi:hypothetical protein
MIILITLLLRSDNNSLCQGFMTTTIIEHLPPKVIKVIKVIKMIIIFEPEHLGILAKYASCCCWPP